MEFVHQVGYSLPHAGLGAAHLAALASVRCLGSAADEVVEPVAEPLDAAEGVVAELAAVGFGKVREKGANAGVERDYAITAWGLDVALRRVRDNEPVEAALSEYPCAGEDEVAKPVVDGVGRRRVSGLRRCFGFRIWSSRHAACATCSSVSKRTVAPSNDSVGRALFLRQWLEELCDLLGGSWVD